MIVNAAAESHVEKSIVEGAREFVTTNVEGHADPPRRGSREPGRALHPSSRRARCTGRPSGSRWTRSTRSTRAPYAATKVGADRLAYSYYVTHGLPIVILRPFNNYGAYQHPEKVAPRFITQALADRPLTCTETATRRATGSTSKTTPRQSTPSSTPTSPTWPARSEPRDRRRHLRRADRRPRPRAARQAGCPEGARVRAAPARSTGTSARRRRPSACSAGGPGRRSSPASERTIAWYEQNRLWWEQALRAEQTASGSAS